MKRTLTLALSAVLVSALAGSAMAQNFPDVPDNHWAFEALARMKKEGLLVGYPDGQFKGPRLATRYEMAVAVYAAWMNLKNQSDGLSTQIKTIEEKMGSGKGGDFADMKSALDSLKGQVDGMKNWGDDVAALKKMAGTFETELKSLGVDVEKMKQSLSDLNDRVTKLEKVKLPVNLSGDVNFVVLGGYGSSGHFGITTDGRPTGVGRGNYIGKVVGATRDLTVLHEAALTLTSTNDSGPKWGGTLVYGNMIDNNSNTFRNSYSVGNSTGFGNQSGASGSNFAEGDQTYYIQDLWVKFDTSLASIPFSASVGRIGYQVSPLLFKRADATPYFSNSRWDNGNWSFDGANLGFKFGAANVNVFGGRNSADGTSGAINGGGSHASNGVAIQPLFAGKQFTDFNGVFNNSTASRPLGFGGGNLEIDNTLGVQAGLPLGDKGHVNLAYIWLNSDNWSGSAGNPNTVAVYGADLTFKTPYFGLSAAYGKSDMMFDSKKVGTNKNNDAYWVNANKDMDKFGVGVGYTYIGALYGAPGDWGRIGAWYNPTDIKGPTVDAHFDLNPQVRINAHGGFYTGTDKTTGLGQSLSKDDKINHFNVGVNYKMAANYDVNLGYETVAWDLKNRAGFTGGKPKETWYNIGLGWALGENSKLNFMWQISDYDAKNIVGFNPTSGSAKAKGGLITTQLTVKF